MADPSRYQTEELRRAAWQVVAGRRLGHLVDPGMGEFIDRLAAVLDSTPGWRPDDTEKE